MADQGQSADQLWASDARLDLLGPVRLGNTAGDDLTPKARKTRALLALVALSKAPLPRTRLVDLLWGDRGEEQGKASLRQALYELRGLTSTGNLFADREQVGLGPKRLRTDLQALCNDVASRDAASLADALEQVSLPLLGGLDDITPELDDWLRDERARLTATLTRGTLDLGRAVLEAGDAATARRLADQLERLDRIDEGAAQLGISADLALGDRAGAARRLGRLQTSLRNELDIEPAQETRALLAAGAPARQARPVSATIQNKPRRKWLFAAALLALLVGIGAALWWSRPQAAAATPMVAVLPFDGAGRKDDGYFASGVSDEILNLLANQKRLKVLGRVSSAQLADPATSLSTARQLGVSYLLDGSVRSAGSQLLVIARLTRVSDGEQVWSERYERRAGDVFAVQGEIAQAVAARMARSLVAGRPQETSPEVYDRYLAARQLLRERRETPLREADRLLREAIARDPNYAPAYAELAQVVMLLADHPTSYGSTPIAVARAEARKLAVRAIQLDPNLGDAYAALGFLSLNLDPRSEPYFRKAVELSPQRTEFHRWHAQTLMAANRFDEGIAEFKRAVEIDPLWGLNYDHLTGALYLVGKEAEARAYARRFLALSTDQRARLLVMRAMANLENRRADELKIVRALYRAYPDERQMRFIYASTLAAFGERRQAAELMRADPVATAVLTSDWPGLARQVDRMGPEFWEEWGFWNIGNLLVASGHDDVIVRHYDRDRAAIEAGGINPDYQQVPEVALALRQVGRNADANRVLQAFAARKNELPARGLFRWQKLSTVEIVAAIRGDKGRALSALEQLARERPASLMFVPAMSLRYDPAAQSMRGDPRLAAADERIRQAINGERVKAGLHPISAEAWISDPKTLLTKN